MKEVSDMAEYISENEEILLPCPFCGGPADVKERTEVIGHGTSIMEHFVQCGKCRARGPKEGEWTLSREACVKLCKEGWNQRTNRINESETDG